MKLSALTTAILVSISSSVANASMTDSLSLHLDSVTVVSKRVTSSLKGSAGTTLYWDMDMMHDLPKILGNADPLHYTQLLPGVQTNSEYDAGLHVQGCDNGHNFVSLGDVPVYNASHLLGFFSVFNASHFPAMRFDRSSIKASAANRLGGTLNMELPGKQPVKTNGEFTIGPMSSQGTLRMPIGKSDALYVSLRAAYLNLLYGQWLKFDSDEIDYHFQDYNVTYLHKTKAEDKLWFNFYYGDDNVGMDEEDTESTTSLKWKNLLSSIHWEHYTQNDTKITQSIYLTRYNNRMGLKLPSANFALPSHICSYGYKERIESERIKTGFEVIFHRVKPQSPEIYGKFPINQTPQMEEKSEEYVAFVEYSQPLGRWMLDSGLKGSIFHNSSEHRTYYSLDPSISVTYKINSNNTLRASYGWQHQYLSRAGFSNIGLPSEFWMSSGNFYKPQYAQSVNFNYETFLFDGDYSLSAEAYYKDLYHQIEYNGNVLDFLTEAYSLKDVLLVGSGENYGINIMLNKRTGKLTGWLSYAWGRAFRRFDKFGLDKKYPAAHERIHELNVVGTFRLNERWSLGGTFVYASGTPFTAPKHFYIMNGQLLSEFGEHNANRLKPYCRLDLSANYSLKKKENYESGINFSVYNALLNENDIFYRLKIHESKFYYSPTHFLMKILPSISYYCKF